MNTRVAGSGEIIQSKVLPKAIELNKTPNLLLFEFSHKDTG